MIDIGAMINKTFDSLINECDFSKFRKEQELVLEWIKRFKEIYLNQYESSIDKEDFVMLICEYPYGKYQRERIDVVLEKANRERAAIEFKLLRMEGSTGESKAISKYVTNAITDITDLDHFIQDPDLNANTAYFFMVTENKNILSNSYSCQHDIEHYSHGEKVSIADGKVLPMPNGKAVLKWEQARCRGFFILKVFRGK